MKNLLLIIALLLGLNLSAQNGGACTYILPDGSVVCYVTGNAGVGAENACANAAIAAGAVPSDCFLQPIAGCATALISHDNMCFWIGTGTCGSSNGCGIALPIELTHFTGVIQDGVVVLNWETATETNNDYFVVSYSIDGESWNSISFIHGAGNSTSELNYRFIHANPIDGINYYKLTQVDFDGVYEEFMVIAIDNKTNTRTKLRTVNTLGQDVDEYYKGVVINQYDDGTTDRKLQ